MTVDCPNCGKDTGKEMVWNPMPNTNEITYDTKFICQHCNYEVESVWETGCYDPITDDWSEGFGYVK